ncbi:MAG TPA: TrkA family potassium uptake protein [Saprospiraceae bacterium]|nr:TrkA family potassium uptake protein [Saprospiraceae bacterium]MCB9327909.1 TrkA family potassium uptake protein [Lewinellaceae bacterium]HPK08932.1 TrkA family potassium uptake protein [Saprospiraceae bacterium]HPQ22272.1 TrkA family potassium uptake protein [Saprospiraceae bacterium]
MKAIVVGLGNFGASLAEKLTMLGNEVIAIDNDMSKVENFKDKITHTICMDALDEYTVSGLPLKDTDIVIIAIGEDQGASVMTTALFKNMNLPHIISRAINPLHEKVLEALGVDTIVHPEEETAERWAKKLMMPNVVDSFEVSNEYSIIEIDVPKRFIGKTISHLFLEEKYQLRALTTIKTKEVEGIFGPSRIERKVQGLANSDTVLNEAEILVLFGANHNLQKFIKEL